ncbi:MAG: glycosyltransferase family 92 protein [Cyclobacteriaceae bacterium]|nr:glycosyltransferase family 92 protein [Cyclobacteriaceae bacterium HetDA_MAG_MS6]
MKKHFLTFATNFKNETPYIKEWLDYHLLVGVDHFYLYDQDGGEEVRELLKPYEDAGHVTRHLWTKYDGTKYDGPTKWYQRNKNHMGFAHCAEHYRQDFQWVMKIDVDEFLYPTDESDSILPWLQGIDAKKIKGCSLPRINFGNNGHETQPKGDILDSYIRREQSPSDHKDLANGDFLNNNRFAYSAHWWHYKWYKFGKMLKPEEIDGIRVNHYYTKSKEEYLGRQNISRGRPKTEEGFYQKNEGCNEVIDEGMLKFVDKLKAKEQH